VYLDGANGLIRKDSTLAELTSCIDKLVARSCLDPHLPIAIAAMGRQFGYVRNSDAEPASMTTSGTMWL
jgi:hypothetical protein